jgi:hypothetical protein
MALSGYTGPTSGRITIKGDDVTRESFREEPLTKDEASAVKWFTDLPPIEQLREVRRLKWNGEEARREADIFKRVTREQDEEIDQLRAKLATFTPEGFIFPPSARDLLDHAKAHGWKTAHAWTVDDEDETVAVLKVLLGHGLYRFDHLRWVADQDGHGRMVNRGLARAPRRDWYDAPSLKRIKEIITEVSKGAEGS